MRRAGPARLPLLGAALAGVRHAGPARWPLAWRGSGRLAAVIECLEEAAAQRVPAAVVPLAQVEICQVAASRIAGVPRQEALGATPANPIW